MPFVPRRVVAADPVEISGWRVKRYLVSLPGAAVDGQLVEGAGHAATALLGRRDPGDPTPRLAFLVLHQGEDALWLTVFSWCQEVILAARGARAPLSGPLVWTPHEEPLMGCVWELPVVEHERSAWVRHVLAGEVADVPSYLSDQLPAGAVGDPAGPAPPRPASS